MNAYKLLIGMGLIVTLIVFSNCGAPRSKCNTKGKIRTEMGWM